LKTTELALKQQIGVLKPNWVFQSQFSCLKPNGLFKANSGLLTLIWFLKPILLFKANSFFKRQSDLFWSNSVFV